MKGTEIHYKDVVIRPMVMSAKDYVRMQRESYARRGYDVDFNEPMTQGEEFNYWHTDKWYIFFTNGRVVDIPHKKCTESMTDFYTRVDKKIKKVEKENTTDLGRFSAMMQRLINIKYAGADRYSIVYPTTYGIGVQAIYNWKFDALKQSIEQLLDGMGVKYENEYSDAMWVYRFKVSKAEANRALIQNVINQ